VPRNQAAAGTTYHRYNANGVKAAASGPLPLTAELVSRGGYRDHTDGNRISTTRGDRVDWVQGNYRRVVFGRATNTVAGKISQSTWESSGGHNHASTSTPGEVKSISWVTDGAYRDTWKVIAKTESGNEIARYSGKVVSNYYGPSKRSVTGKWTSNDNPAYPADVTFTGSDYPVIDKETHAAAITSTTGITTSRSRTTAKDKIESTTLARLRTDEVGQSSSRVARIKDHLAASTLTQQEFYLVKFAHSRGGSATTGFGNSLALNVSAVSFSLGVGVSLSATIGNFVFGVTVARSLEVFFGLEIGAVIGGEISFNLIKRKLEVNGTEVELTGLSAVGNAAKLLVVEKDTSLSDIHL